MTNISIVVPTYRNPKCLDIFLRSATENKTLPNTEILVVVDGYINESQHVLAKYPSVVPIVLMANKGMQTAINTGVYQAKNEAIVVVNDDNVLGVGYDAALAELYDPYVVITINQIERAPSMFNFVVKDLGGPTDFQYDEFIAFEKTIHSAIPTADGNIFPFMISKRWFMVVGGFDTFYDSPNVCDLDFFLKLELCGFEMQRTHALHFYHFGSIATKNNHEHLDFKTREQKAFETFHYKWGFYPSYGVNNTKLPSTQSIRGINFNYAI